MVAVLHITMDLDSAIFFLFIIFFFFNLILLMHNLLSFAFNLLVNDIIQRQGIIAKNIKKLGSCFKICT